MPIGDDAVLAPHGQSEHRITDAKRMLDAYLTGVRWSARNLITARPSHQDGSTGNGRTTGCLEAPSIQAWTRKKTLIAKTRTVGEMNSQCRGAGLA